MKNNYQKLLNDDVEQQEELSSERKNAEDTVIEPFLEWCYYQGFELFTKSNAQQLRGNSAVTLGIIIGSLSIASMYPLGGSFGGVVSDYFKVKNDNIRLIMYHFFGTTATLPMLALSCIEAKDLFQKIAASKGESKIVKYYKKHWYNGFVMLAYIFAGFSALSPMYATLEAFSNSPLWLQYITVPASYVGPLIFKAASEIRLVDRAFRASAPEEDSEVSRCRNLLRKNLISSVHFINRLSDVELNRLFSRTFNQDRNLADVNERKESTLSRIHYFFSHSRNTEEVESSPNVVDSKNGDIFRSMFKGLGFFIGAASSYVYYTLAESAALYLCDYFDIEDEETRETLKITSAVMAVVPWASLGAEATQMVFKKIYDSLNSFYQNRNNAPITSFREKVITTIAAIEGCCAATPPTYLAIKALESSPWYAQLLIIPAFIGPASIRATAIARFMYEGIEWIHDFRKETPKTRRQKLVKTIEKVAAVIERLPDDQVIQLYEELSKTQGFQEFLTNDYPQDHEQDDANEKNLFSEPLLGKNY